MRDLAVVLALVGGLIAAPSSASAAQGSGAMGDGIGFVDPATGEWHLIGPDGWATSFYFGNPGGTPFTGDWDCDGVDTPGLYRRSDGYVYLRNSNTQGVADTSFFFGDPDDIPLAGDFDGDGCDTVSLYRPSEGRVYVIDRLGSGDQGLGTADAVYYFGNPGDTPFAGDFDGDAIDTVGLYRESTGFMYVRNSHTQGVADVAFYFGDPGDRIVTGDWGVVDGIDAPGVFRPSTLQVYLRHSNTQGVADETRDVGAAGWIPVGGRFGLEERPLTARGWSLSRPDTAGDVGRFNSIAVAADGFPVLAYGRSVAFGLQMLVAARCNDAACTAAATSVLHGEMFESTAVVVPIDGPPFIAFHDPWAPGLVVASCRDAGCSAALLRNVMTGGGRGKLVEAGLTAAGPFVVAGDFYGTHTAVRTGSRWTTQVVEELLAHGRPALAVGPDGLARIVSPAQPVVTAYVAPIGLPSRIEYPLRLATCADATCTVGLVERATIHTEVAEGTEVSISGYAARRGVHTSVAVTRGGVPVAAVSWVGGPGLELVLCDTPACASPRTVLVDDRPLAGRFVDLEIAPDGNPIMAYTDGAGAVRVAHCADPACSEVRTATVAEPGPGTEVSLALDRLGMPVLAYYDAAAGDLVVARLR